MGPKRQHLASSKSGNGVILKTQTGSQCDGSYLKIIHNTILFSSPINKICLLSKEILYIICVSMFLFCVLLVVYGDMMFIERYWQFPSLTHTNSS